MKFKLVKYCIISALIMMTSNSMATTVTTWFKNRSQNADAQIMGIYCVQKGYQGGKSPYLSPGEWGSWPWNSNTPITISAVDMHYRIKDKPGYESLLCNIIGNNPTFNPTVIFKQNGNNYSCTAYNT